MTSNNWVVRLTLPGNAVAWWGLAGRAEAVVADAAGAVRYGARWMARERGEYLLATGVALAFEVEPSDGLLPA
jgi:hypothetical protein